jgi:hypothetical protein
MVGGELSVGDHDYPIGASRSADCFGNVLEHHADEALSFVGRQQAFQPGLRLNRVFNRN